MASTRLDSTRDTLYTQWQRDVAEARKARMAEITARQSGETTNLEAAHQYALDTLREQGKQDSAVAKMRLGGEKEIEQMRLKAADDLSYRHTSADIAMQNAREYNTNQRLGYTDGPTSLKAQEVALEKGKLELLKASQPDSGRDPSELANYVHNSTTYTDKKGIEHAKPMSRIDREALSLEASKSGYRVNKVPLKYHSLLPGPWDSPDDLTSYQTAQDVADSYDYKTDSGYSITGDGTARPLRPRKLSTLR